MKDRLHSQLEGALGALLDAAGDTGPPPEFALEVPRQADHGDFACNAAMLLAKRLRKAPREIASALVEQLGDAGGLVSRAEVAGPGFVNFWLVKDHWQGILHDILAAGDRYGASDIGQRRRVQVEFVSANPTGPLSTGHGRQAILGDAVAQLLESCGYDVTREYYFNNGGRQMRVLGQSVRARYLEALGRAAAPPLEAFDAAEDAYPTEVDGLPVEFPRDGYRGEYISEIAQGLLEEHGEGLLDEPAEGAFRAAAETTIFAEIRKTLSSLGIEFDVYYGEQTLYEDGLLEQAIEDLREKGLVYEKDGASWLRATELGLDRDRVVIKSSGEPTYLMPDIAYHREKIRRGFDVVIDVLGADHIEQFPFVRAAVDALGCPADRFELLMHQFVTLTRGGEKVKQSTRRATFVTIDELVEEVGVDVFRFFMVERRAEAHLDFDLDLAADRNWRKNPAYYVQYAHARSCGIERRALDEGYSAAIPNAFEASRLELPEELDLIRKLGEFPALVLRAAETREPHHLPYYLRDVAGLWNPYLQDGTLHRILSDDAELSAARLGLAGSVRTVLANGLRLLGISAPERM
jgi:arginyl-tRNA synthetase